jgi:hypothetical protein
MNEPCRCGAEPQEGRRDLGARRRGLPEELLNESRQQVRGGPRQNRR